MQFISVIAWQQLLSAEGLYKRFLAFYGMQWWTNTKCTVGLLHLFVIESHMNPFHLHIPHFFKSPTDFSPTFISNFSKWRLPLTFSKYFFFVVFLYTPYCRLRLPHPRWSDRSVNMWCKTQIIQLLKQGNLFSAFSPFLITAVSRVVCGLRLLLKWLWRMLSSGMRHCVVRWKLPTFRKKVLPLSSR
jgi:hypothetical protein